MIRTRSSFFGAALLLGVATVSYLAVSQRAQPLTQGWNLILVSIDTLRADRLSSYGYSRDTTPFLEELARESILFERFYYNGGGTLPSHMTMMTSLHPATHGIGPQSPKPLPPERDTFAELLSRRGYATAAFVDGGWVSGKFGFAQGFDIYDESGGHLASHVPKAAKWMERQGNRPFFLFLHTYDVHSSWLRLPYDCPGDTELHYVKATPTTFDGCREGLCASELFAAINRRARQDGVHVDSLLRPAEIQFASDLYDGCIRYVDGEIRGLVQGLRERRQLDRTVLVVTSDHGEEFAEHGFLLHDQGGYEELARIPLIIRLPAGQFGGSRVRSLAAMVDLLPTLAELLQFPSPPQAQGVSQVAAIRSRRPARPDVHMFSVLRTERYKYFSDERLLFDLETDPTETTSLLSTEPNLVRRLERTVRERIEVDLDAARVFSRKVATGADVTLEPEEVERLRALGYLR